MNHKDPEGVIHLRGSLSLTLKGKEEEKKKNGWPHLQGRGGNAGAPITRPMGYRKKCTARGVY